VTFNNGSLPIVVDGVSCLTSFNSLIRMRAFFNNSEITFTGPGEITLQCVSSSGTFAVVHDMEYQLHHFQETWRYMGLLDFWSGP